MLHTDDVTKKCEPSISDMVLIQALHCSKPLISLVPFHVHFHFCQGQRPCYVTIPIVFPASYFTFFRDFLLLLSDSDHFFRDP